MTTDPFDRVQAALAIDPQPRRRRTANESPAMNESLTTPRAKLTDADAALAALEQERAKLESQIESMRTVFEADHKAMSETHKAAAARGLDFSGQLLVRQQAAELAERGAAIELSAFAQRAASDTALQAAREEVMQCEAAVAMEMMRLREVKYLDLAAKTAHAYREARRAAWTIRKKLGRKKTPQVVSDAVFLRRFGQLPFFTSEGASSDAYLAWAATREDVTDTVGVEDELRG